ncbi:replication initiation protein [Sodalis sp. (in: enterobacteria)]|uniref:replication initiation protein n=1 Tax=Sodalis sp. (in: enterobacteria) TaxID=1898979 RepID=UPI003F32FB75
MKASCYLKKIYGALCLKLEADVNYCGLICKNPNHPDWDVTEWEANLYTLDWLADFVDLDTNSEPKITKETTQGRNCALFNALRCWAYGEVRKGCPCYAAWEDACLDYAFYLNTQNPVPLPVSEVKSVAKSVARGTFNNPSAKQFSEYVARTHTPEIQAARGRKSKGGGRPIETNSIERMKPWKALGISRAWYYRQKKLGVL